MEDLSLPKMLLLQDFQRVFLALPMPTKLQELLLLIMEVISLRMDSVEGQSLANMESMA